MRRRVVFGVAQRRGHHHLAPAVELAGGLRPPARDDGRIAPTVPAGPRALASGAVGRNQDVDAATHRLIDLFAVPVAERPPMLARIAKSFRRPLPHHDERRNTRPSSPPATRPSTQRSSRPESSRDAAAFRPAEGVSWGSAGVLGFPSRADSQGLAEVRTTNRCPRSGAARHLSLISAVIARQQVTAGHRHRRVRPRGCGRSALPAPVAAPRCDS